MAIKEIKDKIISLSFEEKLSITLVIVGMLYLCMRYFKKTAVAKKTAQIAEDVAGQAKDVVAGGVADLDESEQSEQPDEYDELWGSIVDPDALSEQQQREIDEGQSLHNFLPTNVAAQLTLPEEDGDMLESSAMVASIDDEDAWDTQAREMARQTTQLGDNMRKNQHHYTMADLREPPNTRGNRVSDFLRGNPDRGAVEEGDDFGLNVSDAYAMDVQARHTSVTV